MYFRRNKREKESVQCAMEWHKQSVVIEKMERVIEQMGKRKGRLHVCACEKRDKGMGENPNPRKGKETKVTCRLIKSLHDRLVVYFLLLLWQKKATNALR